MFSFYMDYGPGYDKQRVFRDIVGKVVSSLNTDRVVHVDGRSLLKSVQGLSADLVHPAPAGMEEISLYLADIMGVAL